MPGRSPRRAAREPLEPPRRIAGGGAIRSRGSRRRSRARGSFDAPDRRRASVGSHRQLEGDVPALAQGREIVRRGRRAVAVSDEHRVDHLRDLRAARGAVGDANLAPCAPGWAASRSRSRSCSRSRSRWRSRSPCRRRRLGGALRRGGRVRRALHEQDRVSVGEERVGDALIVLEHAAAVEEALRRGGHAVDGLDHTFQREDIDLNEPWRELMTRQVRVLRTLACGGRGKEAWEEAKRKVVDAGGRVEEARGRRGCGGTHIAGDGQRVLSRGFLLPDLDRDLRLAPRLHPDPLTTRAPRVLRRAFFDEAVNSQPEV